MRGFADQAQPAAHRLGLALLLAMGLHLALLVIPLDWRILPFPTPRRFEVALLPPVARPAIQEPVAIQESVAAAEIIALPEPEPSQLELAPRPLPPEPAVKTPPPPAPAPPPPARPAVHAVQPVKPVTPPKPVKPSVKPVIQQSVKPVAQPRIKPHPASSPPLKPAVSATRKPVQPPASGRTRPAANPPGSRLDTAALLGQVAGIEAENQRRETAGIRSKRVSPTDTQSLEGFYIAAWVRKVEQIGETNFPAIARKLNLNTGPVLDVAIRADGSLQEVRVTRSSGHAELDQAAQQIVRLGAPYAIFPPQLRQRYDVLHIARSWRFVSDGRVQAR